MLQNKKLKKVNHFPKNIVYKIPRAEHAGVFNSGSQQQHDKGAKTRSLAVFQLQDIKLKGFKYV